VFAAPGGAVGRVLGTLTSDEAGRRWVATFTHDRDPRRHLALRPRHRRGPVAVPVLPPPRPRGPGPDDPRRLPRPRRPAAARHPDPPRRDRATSPPTGPAGARRPLVPRQLGATARTCSSSPTAATRCCR
jgi:hypothetical protein